MPRKYGIPPADKFPFSAGLDLTAEYGNCSGMSIKPVIDLIRTQSDRLGVAELSRRAGVPASTVYKIRAKGWNGPTIEILERLSTAAEIAQREDKAA